MTEAGTRPRIRARCCITVVASLAVIATACGSDGGGAGVETTPATATTNTAAPVETSISPTTTVAATTPPLAEPVTPTTSADTVASTAPATTPVTTPATTSVAETPTTTARPAVREYRPVASPSVPGHTEPVAPGTTDGVYYGTISEGGDPPPPDGTFVFEIVQLFTGDDCIAHFGADDPDACVNDYGVETDPTAAVELSADGSMFISVVDAETQQSHQISGRELYNLLLGGEPAAGAPEGYMYGAFGFLMTFVNGTVTRLEQWWTP